MEQLSPITIKTEVKASPERVWEVWNNPKHIIKWNSASPDWHTTKAESDLRAGGSFKSRMEAKDGSMGFDFSGIYSEVKAPERLKYKLDDGRKVSVNFEATKAGVRITETFDPETVNPIELQRDGWQAILDNFKAYIEQN
ncbi:SRPBCC family protein [Constantimarinum furrinae]|uniref:Activator of Hsp90 ATPase homologue 1/2-like C-terminal domain-containing protein n=1 Tax=Constantimarinum furrinae TaxID=2562285 RepID=A0A7G8PWM7_9FLAO|nr:SRPBCC family protein [Constantimarinum furrinae]QNJ98743.1 hypothetical protein ALE3EI_2198 [Constantimarinum furrinae]